MRLSAKAQYACVAMVELACKHGDSPPVTIKGISEAHGIPQPFLVQILLQLKANGLVESLRGAGGGYQLGKPPVEITLADIINGIEQPPPQTSALAGLLNTPAVQAVTGMLQELHAGEQRGLEKITLADLVRQIEPVGALTYHI